MELHNSKKKSNFACQIKNMIFMGTAMQINITYDQILSLVKQLPRQQKIELTKELEKESIDTQLSSLLNAFHTDELSLKTIDEEVEIVRQQIYDRKKTKNQSYI
jgi:predicted DNA-binding protein YlxM (UPF0122 family)